MDLHFGTVLVIGQNTVSIVETSLNDEKRTLSLSVNGAVLGNIEILSHFFPSYCVTHNLVFMWAGTNVVSLNLSGRTMQAFKEEEEVSFIFVIETIVWVVRDASVVVRELRGYKELSAYDHDEVILESRLGAQGLLFSDLQERHFQARYLEDQVKIYVEAY